MKIEDIYPSRYVTASDFNGRTKLKITRIEVQDLTGRDGLAQKRIVLFTDDQKLKGKGIIVNRTNALTLAAAFGPDTSDWLNKEIVVTPTLKQVFGSLRMTLDVAPAS